MDARGEHDQGANRSVAVGAVSFAQRRPAVIALGAATCGIVLGQSAIISFWWWIVAALTLALLAGIFALGSRVDLQRYSTIIVTLALCCIFALRAGYQQFGTAGSHVKQLALGGEQATVFGSVSDWPDVREHKTLLTLSVDSATVSGKTVEYSGSVLLHIAAATHEFHYNDQLIVRGEIVTPAGRVNPGGFDYARYLRWKDIFGVVYQANPYGISRNAAAQYSVSTLVATLRSYILQVFSETLEPEQAALASWFLIGETASISDSVYNHFRNSGTLHLLAVSGSNVAIVLLTLRLFLWPFPLSRRALYFLLLIGAVLFCLVSENEPSVVRATVMTSVYLLGRILERRIDFHNGIASAGLLILLWSPTQLFDVGFQLSFVVAWMIILFVENINELFSEYRRRRWFRFLLVPLVVALVAQLAAAPLSLYYFNTAPAWSTPANILIGPLVTLAVGMSLVILTVSLLASLLGVFIGSALNYLLSLILGLLEIFGGADSPILRTSLSPWECAAALALLALIGSSLLSVRIRRTTIFALALAPLVLVGWRSSLFAEGSDSIWLYATRGGVAALYESNDPALILMDCDQRPEALYNYTLAGQLRGLSSDSGLAVVAHSADYQTLVCALIVADSHQVNQLYLSDRLQPLASDLFAQGRYKSSSSIVRYLGTFDVNSDDTPFDYTFSQSILRAGRSVSLLETSELSVLFVSSVFSESELAFALASLQDSGKRERSVYLISSQPSQRLAQFLHNNPTTISISAIFQTEGRQRTASDSFRQGKVDGVGQTVFISETGAIELKLH